MSNPQIVSEMEKSTTGQTAPDGEDLVIRLKPQEQPLNGPS